jgi:hypothetical protein
MRPLVKPNSCFAISRCKVPKSSAGKEMLAPPRVRRLSRGGPGGHCRYPADQVPPRTSSRSKQKARHANHVLPRVINLSMNRTARGSSGVTACPAAPTPAAQPGAAPGSPCVPWRPNVRRAIKVNRYPPSVAIMVTLWGVCVSSETPHDKQTPCACKTYGQGRLQGCNSAVSTRCPYTADRYSTG